MRNILPQISKTKCWLTSLLLLMFGLNGTISGQTLLAGWDFQTTTNGGTAAAAAPGTPTVFTANFGTGTLFLNGTNGSSTWVTATSGNELTSFGGSNLNTAGTSLSTVTSGASSLSVLNSSANGKSMVFRFSMTGYKDLVVSYATQRTATGFNSQAWEISTNGTSWTAAQTNTTYNGTSYGVVTLTTITGLDNVANAYLRLTVTGASATAGNNRIDNVQLRATALPTSFTVTYNGNNNTGGAAPVDGSSPYAAGSNVTVLGPGTLERTGFTFTGWNTAANGSGTAYNAGGTITNLSANTILYAQWAINTYTVSYDGNTNTGGTAPVDPSSPYNFNSNVTVLGPGDLTKTGFNFNGWNTAADGSGTPYLANSVINGIAANVVLYAQWIPADSYAVLYFGNGSNDDGDAPVDANSPYSGGSSVTILGPGALLRTGYTFSGWNTAANGSGTPYSPNDVVNNISANLNLFAQWTINTYTVTYDGNTNDGGSAPVDPSSPYNFNTNVTVLGPGTLTKTNHNFAGWNTAANGSGTSYAAGATITGIASNITLYAQWTIITYTVTYNGNTSTGGAVPVDGSSPYAIGSNVTVLGAGSLVKTGHTFSHWNTAADGNGTTYNPGGTITNISANTVLFAQWTINSYTVTYDGNGNNAGNVPVDNNSPYTFGSTVTVLPNSGGLSLTNAVFAGWNTAANGSGINYAPGATFNLGAANVVLYARWVVPVHETFSYTAGDNVGSNSTATGGGVNNNWTTHSNTSGNSGVISVTEGSLSYTGLQPSAGNKIRIPGANATVPRDINRNASLPASQNTTYFSFLLNVADATQLSSTFGTTGNTYFIHLSSTSGGSASNFTSKVHIRSTNSATNFRLGISEVGNTPVEATGDLNFGTTYLVVVKYVYNNTPGNDLATLWVNPASLGGTEPGGGVNGPGSANVSVYNSINTGICIRNAANTPRADIDEIRVGTSWASVTPAVTYQLTTIAGTGGTITAPAVSPLTVNQGAATTITAVANSGYNFSNWTVTAGSASIANANAASTTVTLNSGNATVQANFIPSNFTITATAQTPGGSISPAGEVIVSPGGSQTFTITPDLCNDIAEVIVDGVNSLGAVTSYTFTNVNANHTIDVYFNPSTSTTWTGNVNSNWDEPGNWSSCVPDATLEVTIAAGTPNAPVLNVDAEVNSLTLDDGATLSLSNKVLTINGGYNGSTASTLVGSDAASIVLNSSATLVSSAPIRLKNLIINGGTTTLGSTLEISGGTATVTPGEVSIIPGSQLESNGFLVIKSNQFGTGRVAAGDDAGDYITGDVTVERYIPNNGFRSWRFLSVPTFGSQTIRQAWQEGIANPSPLQNNLPGFGTLITGTGTSAAAIAAGFDGTLANPSFQIWGTSNWVNVASTNTPINTLKGYMLFVRGDRSRPINGAVSNTNATVLRTRGQLYQGTQNIPAFPANSFNAVGNLYASAIDFTQLQRTGGTQELFYIWDSKKLNGSSLGAYQTFSVTNDYECLIPGGSYVLNERNTKIESGQAFFVSTTTAGTLTLTEGSKVDNGASLGFRPASRKPLVRITTRLYAAGSDEILDANAVVFNSKYSKAVDVEDAVKMTNPDENFGVAQEGKILSIEGRNPVEGNDEIVFSMSNMKQRMYELELQPQQLGTQGLEATLEDSYLQSSTPLNLEANTRVSFTVDANPASAAANRFKVVLRKVKPVGDAKAAYTLAPNPVENGVVNLLFSNRPAGTYSVRILSTGGQPVLIRTLNHAGGNATQSLRLPGRLAAGVYMVEITAPGKVKTVERLLVK